MRVHRELRCKLKELTGKDVYWLYIQQRSNAKRRGIAFDLTFPQWAQVWDGKMDMRGVKRGQFVMCRHGDVGPYTPGNVSIRTTQSNLDEHHRLKTKQDIKAAWTFDGVDRSACADWLENRRDMGYL